MSLTVTSSVTFGGICDNNPILAPFLVETIPLSKFSSPAIILNKVVFPQPFGPINAILSPVVASNANPSNIFLKPKLFQHYLYLSLSFFHLFCFFNQKSSILYHILLNLSLKL